MRALSLLVLSNSDEVLGLNLESSLQQRKDSLLDFLVLIIQMDKDGLYSILVKASTPWVWNTIEEQFQNFAGLNSDLILGIIESFKKLRVDQNKVIMVKL